MMQSDRCDLTIPRVESIRHVLPLTTMDTLETMWMNWLLTVPGMSTSPCASTEKCELRVSDTERTHSEGVLFRNRAVEFHVVRVEQVEVAAELDGRL